MKRWRIDKRWRLRHTSSDLNYTVTLELESPLLAQRVWQKITTEGELGTDNGRCFGGVVLHRSGKRFTVTSGGEDGLDSLEYGINDVLIATLEQCDATGKWRQIKATREHR